MTAGNDDVWSTRRRLGETLRRWATPTRTSAPAAPSGPPGRPGRRRPFRLRPGRTAFRLRPGRTAFCRWARLTAFRLRAPRAAFGSQARRLGFCVRLRFARKDRGAATIFVLAVGLVIVLMGVAGAAVGAARIGRHRAQAAADLGALAGAARAVEGTGAACERAGRFVAVNGGRATSCEVSGLEIVVRTEVIVTPLPALTRHATAAARAGPVYAAAS
jgi:secretion/DNA translocation related TadE-like protein